MNAINILINSDNKKNLLDMIKIRNLTTKNDLKRNRSNNKYKCQSELRKISLNSLKSIINNQNTWSLKNNNITEMHLLKYRPKRLIKLKEQGKTKIHFSKIGGLSIDLEKTYSEERKFNLKKSPSQNLYNISDNEKLMNSNNDIEFKSAYVMKFSKISEEFNKLSNFADLFSETNDKRIFEENFTKLSKLIESQNNLLLNILNSNNNSNENNNNISVINNFNITPTKLNFLNTNTKNQIKNKSNIDMKNIFTYTSNNLSINSNPMNSAMTSTNFSTEKNNINEKKLIISWSSFIITLNKFLHKIFNEIHLHKKENEKIKKKSYRDELKLNNKINEVDGLKKYLNRFDINKKINSQIQKEFEIKQLKKEFKKKENEYMILIYKLEDDIRNLTILLEKNKYYYDEYKNISKEVDKNKRQKEILKNKFHKELQDTNVKILIEKDYQEELKVKIDKLNERIEEMKKEKENSKTVNIELQAKIKKLEMVIDERDENIKMLNEELEYYIRQSNMEKFNFNNLKNEFNILEKKLLNLEKVKQTEDQDQINEIDNSNIMNNNNIGFNSSSPIHIKNEDNYGSPSPTDFTQKNNSSQKSIINKEKKSL